MDEKHKEMPKEEKMSPEMCVKAGKCMMADMMAKMKPSKDEYDKMSDEEKEEYDRESVETEE